MGGLLFVMMKLDLQKYIDKKLEIYFMTSKCANVIGMKRWRFLGIMGITSIKKRIKKIATKTFTFKQHKKEIDIQHSFSQIRQIKKV